MTQAELIEAIVPIEKLSLLTKEELIEFYRLEQDYRRKLESEVRRLRALTEELEDKTLLIQDQYVVLKNKFFGRSSERSPAQIEKQSGSQEPRQKQRRVLLPSERYPNAPLIERDITLEALPDCACCGSQMEDSGLTEDSEALSVVPAQYLVIRQKRHTYRCGHCQGSMQTAPNPPKIKEGGSYSDEFIIDVAASKYCDLIPVERYVAIAARAGIAGLPPQSLIEGTHYLADFVYPAYLGLRDEVLRSIVLHADETPHRMLEGDRKPSWFLWGFSAPGVASYFECHATRSGDVASELLLGSKCEYLVSDVYSGYARAVRETNERRKSAGHSLIQNVFCNAHSRRRFKEAMDSFPSEAEFFIEKYQKIYQIESELKGKPPDEIQARRVTETRALFTEMIEKAREWASIYPKKSSINRAISYLLENEVGLTRFLSNPSLPIDNNPQERLLRNPVIGRKTWYGTHSKRGAKTMAVLFSLIESCKMNGVNPRLYLKELVRDLHAGKPASTPAQFKARPSEVKTG